MAVQKKKNSSLWLYRKDQTNGSVNLWNLILHPPVFSLLIVRIVVTLCNLILRLKLSVLESSVLPPWLRVSFSYLSFCCLSCLILMNHEMGLFFCLNIQNLKWFHSFPYSSKKRWRLCLLSDRDNQKRDFLWNNLV